MIDENTLSSLRGGVKIIKSEKNEVVCYDDDY